MHQPTQLALRGENSLLIEWSDGQKREYTFRELREACPCATCREKRAQSPAPKPAVLLPVLSAAEVRPLKILDMKPVGQYAYSIEFSDGHNTGIYTLEFLRALGREIMDRLSAHDVTLMFLSLGILLACARVLGEVAQHFHQPSVIGEIAAGLLLGPTVLGRFAPGIKDTLFPAHGNLPIVLDGMTTLAIALFLLVAGMEVELSTIWKQGKAALSVGIAGIVVPFSLGWATASAAPYALGCEVDADPQIFALFFATALSISALPVIAKTLMDLGLYRTELGMIIIAAAVFNDLIGWIIFAVILGMLGAGGGSHATDFGLTILWTLLFAAGMLTVGRWLIHRILPWLQAHTSWPGGVLSFAFSLALFGAALTEWIGIHAIFGSFLVGVAIGDSSHLKEETRSVIVQFVSFLFAPLFFASIGLKVDFVEKFYPEVVFSVLAIGCLGKILGCGLAARWAGLKSNVAWAVGFGMNARGAMEIILGLLALENGLIRQRMFVALVVLAVVTSMMSGPAIQRLLRREEVDKSTVS